MKIIIFFLIVYSLGYSEITYDDGKIKLDTKMVNGEIISYDLNNENREFNGELVVNGSGNKGIFTYKNGILKKGEIYLTLDEEIPTIEMYYNDGHTKEILAFLTKSYRKTILYPNGIIKYWGDLNLNLQENGEIIEKYDNGIIKSIFTYSNGNLNGNYSRCARTGKLIEKGIIKDGEKINEIFSNYEILYEDGEKKLGLYIENNIEYVINLITNEKFTGKISIEEYDGVSKDYITREKEYKDGLLDGKVVSKEKYGVVTENYKNGKLDGKSIIELSSGEKSISIYKEGEILETYRENNGVINFKNSFKYGLTHGEVQIFNKEGKLIMSQEYKFGKESGKKILYGDDGRVISEAEYVLGIELDKDKKESSSLKNNNLIGSYKVYTYKEIENIKKEVNDEVKRKVYKYFGKYKNDDVEVEMAKVFYSDTGEFTSKSFYTIPQIFSDLEVEERKGYEPLVNFYLIFKDETETKEFREKFFTFINNLNIDDKIGLNIIIMRKNSSGKKYDSWLYSNNLGYNLGLFNIESKYMKEDDIYIMRDLIKDKIIEKINFSKKEKRKD